MAILSSQPKKKTQLCRLGSVYIGVLVFALSSLSSDSEFLGGGLIVLASEVLGECWRVLREAQSRKIIHLPDQVGSRIRLMI
ncbi:hypothetical protein TNCV_3731461 [Trichonephila clavipes]|nr:hypothetical protein TNCV_3731461 [Trichonephila clavipes]